MEFQWVNCHCSHHIITCFFLRDPSLIWNTDGLNCRQLWLYLKSCLCFLQINQQTCWLVTKNRIEQFAISVMLNNRPFLHSNKQWQRVEVRVDKNTPNVWKCPPQARSGAIVCAHWRGMQKRSNMLVNVEHDTWRSLLNRKFCCKRGGSSQIEHLLGMLCKVRSLLVLA